MKGEGKLRNSLVFVLLAIVVMGGCAYLGFHGPTIQSHPRFHAGVTQDRACLQCHHPEYPVGPPTPHPGLKGCVRCHNDDIESR